MAKRRRTRFKSTETTIDYYKDLNDYYKQQNEYLSEQNRLLYQELLYMDSEESQNLSVEGQKKLDEIFDTVNQQNTERHEQLQEQRKK